MKKIATIAICALWSTTMISCNSEYNRYHQAPDRLQMNNEQLTADYKLQDRNLKTLLVNAYNSYYDLVHTIQEVSGLTDLAGENHTWYLFGNKEIEDYFGSSQSVIIDGIKKDISAVLRGLLGYLIEIPKPYGDVAQRVRSRAVLGTVETFRNIDEYVAKTDKWTPALRGELDALVAKTIHRIRQAVTEEVTHVLEIVRPLKRVIEESSRGQEQAIVADISLTDYLLNLRNEGIDEVVRRIYPTVTRQLRVLYPGESERGNISDQSRVLWKYQNIEHIANTPLESLIRYVFQISQKHQLFQESLDRLSVYLIAEERRYYSAGEDEQAQLERWSTILESGSETNKQFIGELEGVSNNLDELFQQFTPLREKIAKSLKMLAQKKWSEDINNTKLFTGNNRAEIGVVSATQKIMEFVDSILHTVTTGQDTRKLLNRCIARLKNWEMRGRDKSLSTIIYYANEVEGIFAVISQLISALQNDLFNLNNMLQNVGRNLNVVRGVLKNGVETQAVTAGQRRELLTTIDTIYIMLDEVWEAIRKFVDRLNRVDSNDEGPDDNRTAQVMHKRQNRPWILLEMMGEYYKLIRDIATIWDPNTYSSPQTQ